MATKGYLVLLGGMREIERILKERMHEDEETIEQNGVPLLVESMADQIDELKQDLEEAKARPVEVHAFVETAETVREDDLREGKAEAGELRDWKGAIRCEKCGEMWVSPSRRSTEILYGWHYNPIQSCKGKIVRHERRSRPAPAAIPEGLRCPFCKEGDFDLIGLRHHLMADGCKVFDETLTVDQERERRAALRGEGK